MGKSPFLMEKLNINGHSTGWWFQPTPLKNDGVCQLG
jgi:hypothetical protein